MSITLSPPRLPRLRLPRLSAPRWVWVALGVACLALLIWFVGPLIAVAGVAPMKGWITRTVLIGLLVAIVAGVWGWRRWKAKKANDAMMRDLAAKGEAPAAPEEDLSAADIEAMEERATKALALMREGRVGKDRELIYELPWYVIIGPPGAGKTTALQNAGLNFPVAQELGAAPVRGIGGTRTVEWWFTDRAVLIDTAGRYTTQDSQQAVDAKAWNGLLDILKRYRPRQPVTGVIVAVSVVDLLAADESQALAHGRAVRSRINEIAQKTGVRTPVYVLLTKLDLLAGFAEFFDDLDQETREQVWGHTFPIPAGGSADAKAELDALPGAFQGLVERLTARLLPRTQAERDMQRRGLIFGFPQQFAAIEAPLNAMMAVIARDTRFEPTPMVRGVYFTSGTQFGRPIDRLLASIAQSFGVDEAPSGGGGGRGRSFFLRDLLDKVMFPEAALAGRDAKAERRRKLIRAAVISGCAAALLLLTAGWVYGYLANARLTNLLAERGAKLQAHVAALPQGDVSDSDLADALPVLDEARVLPFASTAPKDLRSAGFSFGVGRAAAMRPQVDGAYANLLNRLMLPRLVLMLEDRLRASTSGAESTGLDAQTRAYHLLRIYLMLGRGPGAPLERAQVQGWFENAWAERYPGEEDAPLREKLGGHLASLLAAPLKPPPLDRDLIAQARTQVATLSPGERVYTRILDDPDLRNLPPYAIADIGEVGSSGLFARKSGKPITQGVPGMFRRSAFYGPVLAAIGKAAAASSDESWVTGQPREGSGVSEAGRIKDGILIAYLTDFTRRWDDYIADIGISPQYPMDERIHRATRPPSPVKALFASLASETNVTPPSFGPNKGGAANVALRTAALFSRRIYGGVARVDQVGYTAAYASGGAPTKGPLDEVIDHFRWLRELQPPQGPSPLDDALNALKDTGDSTLAAKTAAGMGDAGLQKDKTGAAMASTAKLKASASGLPPVAGGLFTGFVNASTTQLNQGAKSAISQAWTQSVAGECKAILTQGYPFKAVEHQTSVDDFSRLFRPGGLLDQFEQANLTGDIDKSHEGWTLTPAGKALNLPLASIRELERADRIRRAFFKPGDIRPNVRFVLEPVGAPVGATAVTVTVDGVPAAFDAGARRPVELRWPGSQPGAQVSFQGAAGSAPAVHGWTGDWAFARMLDEAKTSSVNAGGLTFETAVDSYKASFRVRYQNTTNPFIAKDLRSFTCPSGF